jgi:Spy/CpxP family protein refolding chaperone
VVDAELERLLTRDNIDLDAVRAKVKESEGINTDIKTRQIESLLKAINTLTHEQHLRILTLVQELQTTKKPQQPESM